MRAMATTNGTFGWKTAARDHLFIDLYSEEAGRSILVLDERLRPVTQAFGRRKSDAWDEVERELKKRGLLGS
jgi:hypothetical protein